MTTLNKKKSLLSVLLLAGALTLSGCGEEPYELQDNEREIIVNYAAHVVAKYNVKQPEGYRYVYVSPQDDMEEEEQPQDAQTEENDENVQQPDEETKTDDVEGGEDIPSAEEQPSITLSEALGLKGIQAVYTGAELTDHYQSIIPESGKKLLILHVTLQNQTEKARKCDILSLLPVFRAKVNGTEEVTSELTILEDNLSTWEKKIPAGGSEDTMILFQVREDAITSVDQLELKVIVGEKTSRVVFL